MNPNSTLPLYYKIHQHTLLSQTLVLKSAKFLFRDIDILTSNKDGVFIKNGELLILLHGWACKGMVTIVHSYLTSIKC